MIFGGTRPSSWWRVTNIKITYLTQFLNFLGIRVEQMDLTMNSIPHHFDDSIPGLFIAFASFGKNVKGKFCKMIMYAVSIIQKQLIVAKLGSPLPISFMWYLI